MVFVLVGDERIELPQVESESTALPLMQIPIIWFASCGVSRSTVLLYPQVRCLSSFFLKKVALFGNQRSSAKFPALNDNPAHRFRSISGPWAGAFIWAYCSRRRPARFPVRQGLADTAGASSGAGPATIRRLCKRSSSSRPRPFVLRGADDPSGGLQDLPAPG